MMLDFSRDFWKFWQLPLPHGIKSSLYVIARVHVQAPRQPSLPQLSIINHPIPYSKMSNAGWEVRFSNSKQLPYFYQASTGQSVWDKPADMTVEEVNQLPGAKQYLGGQGGKPGQVRSSHILAKHTGSRRPSSWKSVRT
jgi:hypothetical protein